VLFKSLLFTSVRYKYGFNGKENDNEVKGEGNQQDYGMRIYDSRVDPISKEYPELTPYQFASNKPINSIDLDGLEAQEMIDAYKWAGNKMKNIVVGTAIGIVELVAHPINSGNQIKESIKSTANDIGTMSSTWGKIMYGQFTGKSVEINQTEYNEAAHRNADRIVDAAFSTVMFETASLANKIAPKGAPKVPTVIVKSFDDLAANPKAIWGKTADEVGEILGNGWEKKPLNSGEGWKFLQKDGDGLVSFTTGNTHHPNSTYYKINSGTSGKTKVVGEGYTKSKGDKSKIVHGK
jgi:hypothetical protein